MNSLVGKYDYFLFDLDNTLYSEIRYLDEAYLNISQFLETKTKIKSHRLYDFLLLSFKEKGRTNLFNDMFAHFEIDSKHLKDILKIMRTFKSQKKIPLYSKMYQILPEIINTSKQVFVVTNGNVIQQNNKVKNIEWKSLEKELIFIFANEYERKPSRESFSFIKEKYLIKEKSTIMIGDSIFDKEYAENCKIDFMFVEEFNPLIN